MTETENYDVIFKQVSLFVFSKVGNEAKLLQIYNFDLGQASRPKRDRPKIVSTILHKALAYSTHTYLKLHTDEQAAVSRV